MIGVRPAEGQQRPVPAAPGRLEVEGQLSPLVTGKVAADQIIAFHDQIEGHVTQSRISDLLHG
jgi:hypothetical protein